MAKTLVTVAAAVPSWNRSKRQGDAVEGADPPRLAVLDRGDLAADLVVGVLDQRAVQLDLRLGQQRAVVDVRAEQG